MVAFIIGLHWGITGVAAAYAISSTFVEPVLTVITARALGVSPWVPVRSIAGVVQAAVMMAAAVLATRARAGGGGRPGRARGWRLTTLVGAIVFGAACLWREPELKREVRTIIAALFKTPIAAARCRSRRLMSGIPSVSVVVATHNRAERLRGAARGPSAPDAPRDRFEVIVVDDGSRRRHPGRAGRRAGDGASSRWPSSATTRAAARPRRATAAGAWPPHR